MISSLMIVIRTIITNLLFLNLLNLCINILGCDIADEEEDMPLAAASILTADEDTEALVKFTRSAVQPFGVEVDLRVTREQDVLPQMIRKYKNPIFDVTKPLNVEFVGLGENGVDAGGITREYFNLLMEGIKQRSSNGITLLEGNLGHLVPIHDYELLSSGLFIIVGKMILHAVLNNCTGISGISPAVVKYIATGRRDSAVEVISLDDIPDPCLKEQLEQVCGHDFVNINSHQQWLGIITIAKKRHQHYCTLQHTHIKFSKLMHMFVCFN